MNLAQQVEPTSPPIQAPATGSRRAYTQHSRHRQTSNRQDEAYISFDDAAEDQSSTHVRQGMRVRHPTFGIGTIESIEPLQGDVKLIVRFATVGPKKLLGRYAKLDPA